MIFKVKILFTALLILICPVYADFSVVIGNKTYTCIENGSSLVAGVTNRGQAVAFRNLIKNLKKRLSKSGGINASIQSKIQRYVKLNKQVLSLCKQNSSGGSVNTPAPTGNSGNSGANFDDQGNVTLNGKNLFLIPAELSANVSKGQLIHERSCLGCHSPKLSRSFPYLREKLIEAPMFFNTTNLPDQELADLTAYLNRYR